MAYPISPSSFPPPRSPPSVDSNFYHISFRNPVFISSQRNLQPRSFSLPVSRSPVSTICCCHRKSSEPSSPSDDGRWDLPLHQFLRIAVQKFDAFVKSRMNSQSTKNAAMEGDEQRQNEVEKLNVEEDDAGSWDWERWQKHFMEVEEQERLVDTLKGHSSCERLMKIHLRFSAYCYIAEEVCNLLQGLCSKFINSHSCPV